MVINPSKVYTNRNTLVFVSAFAFKSLASGISIYSISAGTAIEVAPTASILISSFGLIPASIIVNLIWGVAIFFAYYMLQKIVPDGKIRSVTMRVAAFFVVVPAAADGFWDFGVLLRFSQLYLISILTMLGLSTAIYYYFRRVKASPAF